MFRSSLFRWFFDNLGNKEANFHNQNLHMTQEKKEHGGKKRQVDAVTHFIEKNNKGDLIDELKIPTAKHKTCRQTHYEAHAMEALKTDTTNTR